MSPSATPAVSVSLAVTDELEEFRHVARSRGVAEDGQSLLGYIDVVEKEADGFRERMQRIHALCGRVLAGDHDRASLLATVRAIVDEVAV